MNFDVGIENCVCDIFVHKNSEIVVLNSRIADDFMFNKLLLLGKVIHTPLGNSIVALTEEEYDEAANYYLNLKSAFLGKEGK